ncbi:MAG: hypothetical protein ABJ370_00200 [Paracoccaceae bacterium]
MNGRRLRWRKAMKIVPRHFDVVIVAHHAAGCPHIRGTITIHFKISPQRGTQNAMFPWNQFVLLYERGTMSFRDFHKSIFIINAEIVIIMLPCFPASLLPCFPASLLPCFPASLLPKLPSKASTNLGVIQTLLYSSEIVGRSKHDFPINLRPCCNEGQ